MHKKNTYSYIIFKPIVSEHIILQANTVGRPVATPAIDTATNGLIILGFNLGSQLHLEISTFYSSGNIDEVPNNTKNLVILNPISILLETNAC